MKIGQFCNVGKDVEYTKNYGVEITQEGNFKNAFTLTEGNIFAKDTIYYIKANLKYNSAAEVVAKLVSSDGSMSMTVKITSIEANTTKTFEAIVMPPYPFKYLVFYINGQIVNIDSDPKVHQLNNLLKTSYFQGMYPGLVSLKHIGVQGSPGLKFSINGEEFAVNSTGIFELNDMNVANLAFMVDANTSPFIVDFQY